jgi:IclR family acetate operon transcriptional repressor
MRQNLYPLRAVDRVCDILDLLAENAEGVTLSFLAATLDLPKSSAFRYLAALEVRGYVVRTDDPFGYRLGAPLAGHTLATGTVAERLVAVAKPLMNRMLTPEAPICVLGTLDGAHVRYLSVAAATKDPRIPKVGDGDPLHNTALGKAIAAQLSDDTVVTLVEAAGMEQTTPSTLTSTTELRRELHLIRGEGFAMSDGERLPDVRSVAVPIGGHTLAIGVSGRSADLTADRIGGTVRRLRRAASVLAREVRR